MKIEMIKTDKLVPFARNSRTHSEAQVSQIAASIREFAGKQTIHEATGKTFNDIATQNK